MIRYSDGPVVDMLYTSDGTKSNMISAISTALSNAGWISLGSGLFQSATTPSGQQIRVDVIDTGGLCVHLRLRTPTLTNQGFQDGAFLFPVSGRTFRILANQYQLFHFFSGSTFTADPCDVAFGVPYIPPFLLDIAGSVVQIDSWMGWMAPNAIGDPGSGHTTTNFNGFHGIFPAVCNAAFSMWIWDTVAFYDIGGGDTTYFVGQAGTRLPTIGDQTGLWVDGSISMYEPYILWPSGHTTSGNTCPQTRHGQLWDAVVYGDQLNTEVTVSFDDHVWRNVTHGRNTGGTQIPHSLLLLTN